MNLDYSPENQPKGTYRKAMNALSPLDAQGELSNEKGKQLTDTLPGDILGDISIPSMDMSVLFLSNNEIVKFSKGKYSSIYYDKDLNFSTKVYGDFVIKNNGDVVIIFWDGKNEVRNLNITDASKCTKEKLSLFNKLSHCPLIKNINISTSGGIAVNTGAYQFWIRYKTEDGELSNCILIDNFIPVTGDNGTKFDNISGSSSFLSTSSIQLKLSGTDQSYPFVEYGVIQVVQGVTTAKSLDVINNTSELILEYKGKTFNEYSIDVAEIITPFAFYTTAKYGLIYDNKLLLGGVKRRKNISYQKYANQIKPSYIVSQINVDKTNGYKNPLHILHHKSWQRDEIYAVAIVLKYDDGTTSAPFHIPGPEPTSYDTDSIDANDCCNDIINKGEPRWKVENTAIQEASYVCDSLLEKDNCQFVEGELPIKSRGKLAYWQSCTRYPLIKDENNEYIYPTENVNGEIMGQFIRHWKMPDSNVEPFFYSGASENNEWKYTHIYPLGVKVENVYIPENEGIVGWELVYVKRDVFNKTILDKGLFIKTYKSKYNGKDYIYPKNCVNSARGLDAYTELVEQSIQGEESGLSLMELVKLRAQSCLLFKNNGNYEDNDTGFVFYGGNTLVNKGGMDLTHIKVEKQFSGHGKYYNQYNNDKDGRWREVETQSYSLTTQTPYNKQLCVNDWSYMNANTILSKSGNISHTVFNRFRESSVFIETKGTDTLFLRYSHLNPLFNMDKKSDASLPYANDWYYETQLGNVGWDDIGGSHLQSYPFITELNAGGQYRQNYGALHYGSLKRENCNAYENISNLQYISTGLKACGSQSFLEGLYGDSYINFFSFHRTSLFMNDGMYLHPLPEYDEVEGSPTEGDIIGGQGHVYVEDRSASEIYLYPYDACKDTAFVVTPAVNRLSFPLRYIPKPHATLINTFIESDVNLDLRQEDSEIVYPLLKNKEKHKVTTNDKEFPEDAYLNSMIYKLYCRDFLTDGNCCNPNPYNGDCIRGLKDNYFKVNSDYSHLNETNKYLAINENYNVEEVLDNIIAVSETNNEGNKLNLKNFRLNNFVNLPNRYGGITNLFQIGGTLYAHTTDNIFRIITQNSTLQTSESTIYIGNGSILSATPIPMFISDEGNYGLNERSDSYQNSYGYFFRDSKTKLFHHFNGQAGIKDINNYGLFSYLNSVDVTNLHYTFDFIYKRLIISCDEFTLSYEPTKELFRSFHNYDSSYYLNDRYNFYSIKNREIYKHHEGAYLPFTIEGSVPFEGEAILNDIQFKTKTTNDSESTFDKLMLFNKRQCSGLLNLVPIDYTDMNTLIAQNDNEAHVNRYEQYWSVNEFTDRGTITNELWEQPILETKDWWNTEKFRSDFITIRLSYNQDSPLILSFINANKTKL